jgi:hypothetical protein
MEMKRNPRQTFLIIVAALLGLVAIATTVLAGQPSARDSGIVPAELMNSMFPVGSCGKARMYSGPPPTELDLVILGGSSGWLRPDAAFVGDLNSAARAFNGRVALSEDKVAWIEREGDLLRLDRFDLSTGTVWVLMMSMTAEPCPVEG